MSASHVELDHGERVSILQELHVTERLRKIIELVSHRTNVLQVKRDLDQHVRDHLSRHEHEAVLRHRLRAIQSELGESDDDEQWIDNLEARLQEAELPDHAATVANRELERLRRMNPQGNEATIVRTYLEWFADLPWSKSRATPDRHDIAATRQLLEDEHYGIQKVKKRVLEYLSVRKLAPDKRGPILCLSGPPGVGKTSLGRSIAEALGREFVRASLGGVRDDAEIRGHRRTYVGALPGRIIQGMKRAGTINPVFVLDEIDKLTAPDLRGDPAGALLEALDPETNHSFEDHYLATGYDLSRVIFICTGNDTSAIPGVLRDRFELIELSGYTVEEKIAIARDYLLPRETKAHGLGHVAVQIPDEILLELATGYTRESGVRNLQREIAALLRDVAMGIAEGKAPPDEITGDDLLRILGPPKHHEQLKEKEPAVGVVTGLGWTPTGGRLLFVEVSMAQGDGNLRLTGRLGEVMKESGQTALSFVRSATDELGIDREFLKARDIHLHVPAGAVPKDGPSAGITAATALISALTGRAARPDIAMTGEITLRGRVLPIGVVREKVLAAHRAGIRRVILPDRNRKDEPDLPERCLEEMTLHYVKTIYEVLQIALLDPSAENAAE
jgi:ATP-dependent Lon protease